ncbi:hypothetical protein MMC15_008577 [Xylographa vitiligo]|nr:hypothetical protein [Xylographa vitiligo]
MSDLLASLLVPNSSQESFHSAASQPTTHPPSPQPQHTLPTPHGLAPLHLYDVSTFLSSPTTTSLLSTPPSTNTKTNPPLPSTTTTTTTALPLSGPHSAASVSRLYQLCQAKGLTPLFAIDEDPLRPQWFRGSLAVGPATLALEASQPTKKQARQLLAERGCALVRGMPARDARPQHASTTTTITTTDPEPAAVAENWVGKLLEFSAQDPTLPAPTFTDLAVGAAFACECRLAQRAGQPFGGADALFASKKAAKAHAAREAVRFLVERGDLEAGGGVRAKRGRRGVKVRVEERGGDGDGEGERSWGARVVDLCTLLAIHPPTYRLAAPDPATAPHIYSGAAHFDHEPLLRGPVGEVRNVFGRRNAREECARGVVAMLEGVRRGRGG